MLPKHKTPFLECAVVGVAGSPEGCCIGRYTCDTRAKDVGGNVGADLEDEPCHVEADDGGVHVWGYEETAVAHVDVRWVEGDGLDGYEDFVWTGLGGGSGLDGEGLAWGEGHGGLVGISEGALLDILIPSLHTFSHLNNYQPSK